MENRILVGSNEIESVTTHNGEVDVTVFFDKSIKTLRVTAHIANSEGIIQLMMVRDAISRGDIHPSRVTTVLYLPYIPYSSQGSVLNQGKALPIKVFCEMINSLNFDKVVVFDPYDNMALALINNVSVIRQSHSFQNNHWLTGDLLESHLLVAPKDGSQRIKTLCRDLSIDKFVQGCGVENGSVSDDVFWIRDTLGGKDLLIVDNVFDDGDDILGLATTLKHRGASSVKLWVSHGIFSKGLQDVFDNGIDHVYTTNSIASEEVHESLTRVNWI